MKLDLASGVDIENKDIIMNLGLIGTKLGMTRVFKTGQSVPVTVIKIEKGRVLDIINKEKKEDTTQSRSAFIK